MLNNSASGRYDAAGHNLEIHPSRVEPRQEVRLVCQFCHRRKIKCDKLSPCTSCERSGIVCIPVQRARLPRGRTLKSSRLNSEGQSELRDRLLRLEQLMGNPDGVTPRSHGEDLCRATTSSPSDQLPVFQHTIAGTEGFNVAGYQSHSRDAEPKPPFFMRHLFTARQQAKLPSHGLEHSSNILTMIRP